MRASNSIAGANVTIRLFRQPRKPECVAQRGGERRSTINAGKLPAESERGLQFQNLFSGSFGLSEPPKLRERRGE